MKGNSLYRDNVALLYRHFDEYRTNSRMFMAPLPFEVKYVLCTGRREVDDFAPDTLEEVVAFVKCLEQ